MCNVENNIILHFMNYSARKVYVRMMCYIGNAKGNLSLTDSQEKVNVKYSEYLEHPPRAALPPNSQHSQKLNESFLSFIMEDYRSTCKMDRGRVTLSSLRIHARKPILSTLRLLCLMSRLLLWE